MMSIRNQSFIDDSRLCLSKEQKEYLLRYYEGNNMPKRYELSKMAQFMNIPQKKLARWFQNRRYKMRHRASGSPTSRRSSCSAPETRDGTPQNSPYSSLVSPGLHNSNEFLDADNVIGSPFNSFGLTDQQDQAQVYHTTTYSCNPYEGLNPEHVDICQELEFYIRFSALCQQQSASNNQIVTNYSY